MDEDLEQMTREELIGETKNLSRHRTTFETHDGGLILATYQGTVDFGEDGYDKFLRGEMPPIVKIRTSPQFVTSHPDYLWLNRLFCLGVGEYGAATNQAKYDVYAVR